MRHTNAPPPAQLAHDFDALRKLLNQVTRVLTAPNRHPFLFFCGEGRGGDDENLLSLRLVLVSGLVFFSHVNLTTDVYH